MALSEVIAGGIGFIGGIATTLAGVWFERHLRKRGRVEVRTRRFEMLYLHRNPIARGLSFCEPSRANTLGYYLDVEIFNARDEATGFRGLQVQFEDPGHGRLAQTPRKRGGHLGVETDPVETINLPANEWVNLDLMGTFEGSMTRIASCNAVYLVYSDHRGREHRHLLARKEIADDWPARDPSRGIMS